MSLSHRIAPLPTPKVADDAPGPLVDISNNEDEGVDGFHHEISVDPVAVLEPFDSEFAIPTGLCGMEMLFGL